MAITRPSARNSKPVPRRQNPPARQSAPPRRNTAAKAPSRPKIQWRAPRLPWEGIRSTTGWALCMVMAVVLLGGATVGLLYGYRYLTISPYFAVKSIEIEGNFRLTSREVLETAGMELGTNSLALSLNTIEKNLALNPWVKTVSAKRELPDRFFIRLTEKEPKFWVRRDGALYYADVYGSVIAQVASDKFTSFPTLEVENGAEDMTGQLPGLIRSLSEARLAVDMSSVSLVRLSPGRGVEVFLENNRLVLSIGQEDWTANLDRLAATLADLSRRGELKQVREIRAHDAGVLVVKDKPVAVNSHPYGGGEA